MRIKPLRPIQLPLDKVSQSGRYFHALTAHAVLYLPRNLKGNVSRRASRRVEAHDAYGIVELSVDEVSDKTFSIGAFL